MIAYRRLGLVLAVSACLSIGSGAVEDGRVPPEPSGAWRPTYSVKPIQVAVICFLTGERVSGLNKICYYDCLGSEAAITINAVALCPLSINR